MDVILDRVSISFGEKKVLQEFSHRFPSGKISCILGPSGCGKTTLLRLVMGSIPPDSGSISPRDQKNSAVFQENRLFENLTCEKNIMLTAKKGFTRADARALLDELGLGREAAAPVRELSGGMQRRVAIARSLAADYDILLLDEPLKGLDSALRSRVTNVILRHSAGRTVLWVTHDDAIARLPGANSIHLDLLSAEANADFA